MPDTISRTLSGKELKYRIAKVPFGKLNSSREITNRSKSNIPNTWTLNLPKVAQRLIGKREFKIFVYIKTNKNSPPITRAYKHTKNSPPLTNPSFNLKLAVPISQNKLKWQKTAAQGSRSTVNLKKCFNLQTKKRNTWPDNTNKQKKPTWGSEANAMEPKNPTPRLEKELTEELEFYCLSSSRKMT